MTEAEMRAKRDAESLLHSMPIDDKGIERNNWDVGPQARVSFLAGWDAAVALMSEERERLKKLCWKKEQSVRNAQTEMYQSARDDMDEIISAWNECAEKLANALDICKDEIMGCGAHRTDDSQKLADEALAHFEKLKEGS